MYCKHWMLLLAFLAIGVLGCGGSEETPSDEGTPATEQPAEGSDEAAAAKPDPDEGPRSAVTMFLEAVRRGDDAGALAMFTPLARQEVAKLGDIQVAPEGSDTAEFSVGAVEYLNQTGARVAATWTDFVVETNQRRTDRMLWMVRYTGPQEGWRVAGMAAEVVAGEPPMHLNFEDPEETLRQLEQLRTDLARREAEATLMTGRNDTTGPPRR